jgi:hypothetical protein
LGAEGFDTGKKMAELIPDIIPEEKKLVSITMNIVLDLMKKGSLLEFNLILKREIK